MKAKKWKLAERARRECALTRVCVMREGAPRRGVDGECAKQGEEETKWGSDERNKGQIEKSPRVFVHLFARLKNEDIFS